MAIIGFMAGFIVLGLLSIWALTVVYWVFIGFGERDTWDLMLLSILVIALVILWSLLFKYAPFSITMTT